MRKSRVDGGNVHASFVASLFEDVLGHGDMGEENERACQRGQREGLVEKPGGG